MSDLLLVCAPGTLYEPDALASFAANEPAEVCDVLVDLVLPAGIAGDVVFRRLYILAEWESGLAVTITPVIDGQELPEHARTLNRAGSGREPFMLSLARRGHRASLAIRSTAPTGRFAIEGRVEVVLIRHPVPFRARGA